MGDKNKLENDGFTNAGFYHEVDDDKERQTLPQMKVIRPNYAQESLNNELNYFKPQSRVCKKVLKKLTNVEPKACFFSVFPVFAWLSNYSWKSDIISDLISGCTVAVMHIPQGMGYALLANVPPIVGIYMAFFPVLLYFIFGTSKHNSMGTFAVISIMVGKSVMLHSNTHVVVDVLNSTNTPNIDPVAGIQMRSPLQIATVICFVVGLIQLGMYVFRLGVISFLLSETLVSGFTTGAAVHVLTSQIKDLLGISLPAISGNFKIIYTYIEIFNQLVNVNLTALLITAITIIILVINNEYLKPKMPKKCIVPVPIELIAVIGGTLISKYLALESIYNIKTIGHIPTGLPAPILPDMSLIKDLAVDSFTIAMVSYTVSVSMALIFAQKLNYEIDFNQELLAMGLGNVFGSFFSCMPFSASLSRSLIQQSVGGKTQIASLISCAILLVVLLCIGPFFEPLPRCVLASIIVVALKGMLMQVKQFRDFWRLSCIDALVWMATFLTVVLVAIDIGLLVGILLSLACIFFRGMKPYTCLLGNVPNTDLYLDTERYKGAIEVPNIKIFHYCGSLNFASRTSFKNDLSLALKINIANEIKNLNITQESCSYNNKQISAIACIKCLIIDFTALTYIDPSGVSSLKLIMKDFGKLSITVLISGSSCPVYEMMKKCKLIDDTTPETEQFRIFPTVHDAVHYANENIVGDCRTFDVISCAM